MWDDIVSLQATNLAIEETVFALDEYYEFNPSFAEKYNEYQEMGIVDDHVSELLEIYRE